MMDDNGTATFNVCLLGRVRRIMTKNMMIVMMLMHSQRTDNVMVACWRRPTPLLAVHM